MLDVDALILAPLMSQDIFGEVPSPLWTPAAGGAATAIDGVFDEAYAAVDSLDTGDSAVTVGPTLGVRLSQFPGGAVPKTNDTIVIPRIGNTYVVREVRPDGHGHARLLLNIAEGTFA
jgi:hypothetical protein